MQANSPHPGQWQNLHGNVNPSGDWTSNNTDYRQKCFPPHPANLAYPGQSPTGNYLAQFSCTILQSPNDQIGTGSTQSTDEMKPAQENPFNSKHMLPTEKQNSNIVMWTMPGSNVQIFVPGNNMSVQKTVKNGQNISHCAPKPGAEAFNYNNMAYMQHKTTCTPAGPYTLQQFPTKTIINNMSLNDTRRDLSPCISQHRQNHANSTDNLPKSQSKKRMTLSSDTKHCTPTKNARNGGIIHHKLRTESSSTHANQKALSTCKDLRQNNAAKKAVAVVTPIITLSHVTLSPIELSSVNLSNKSNFPHPLGVCANVQAFGELNDPTSKHQRPLSGEPSKDNDAAKSLVLTLEQTSQSNNTPNNAEQNKSADKDESSEKIPDDNYALTDKKTNTGESDGYFTIPVIKWSLDKLHTLIGFIQQIEDGHQRNISKTDAGKEILMLFWNGDVCKFHDAVQSKIYQNVMEEVFNYCQSKDDVILKQILNDARNQVAKDFHVLQHNEVPPTMEYKSSWLNLNEKLDDIDRECGYSWHFKYPHSFPKEKVEHEENSTCKSQHKSQDASETVTETIDKVPEVEQTLLKVKNLDKKSLHENVPVYSEFLLVTDDNHSTKLIDVVAEQTKCQPNKNLNASSKSTAKSDCAATDESEIVSKSSEEAEQRNMEMDQIDTSASENNISLHQTISDILQEANAAPQEIKLSCLNPTQVPDTTSREEQISIDQFEEKTKSYGHSIQSTDPSITGHDRCTTEIMSKVPKVQTCFELKENSSGNMRSLHENSHEQSNTETNCSPNPDDVVTEQTNCQPNAINPLTNLVKTLDDQVVSKRQRSTPKALGRPRQDDKSPIQTNESTKARNSGSHDQIVGEQQKLVSVFVNEKSPAKPDNNCSLTCKHMDTEANIANPLMAMAGMASTIEKRKTLLKRQQEQDEDLQKDTAGPPEIVHASSWLDSEECDNTDKQCDYSSSTRSFHKLPKLSQVQQTVGNFEDKPRNSEHAEQNSSLDVIKIGEPSEEDLLGKEHHSTEVSEMSRLDGSVCSGTEDQSPVLSDEATNQSNLTSPPKLSLVMAEQQEFVSPPEVITEDFEVKALASMKINVLAHEIAEKWFAGKMTNDQDFQTDTDVLISSNDVIEILDDVEDQVELQVLNQSDDQIKVEVLDHCYDRVKVFFPEVHAKDVKPKERNIVDVELESYCCLAKWFQSLKYGDGSWCMCQQKAEISEQKIKIKAHGTSLKVTSDENLSECMKTKSFSVLHTDMPNDAAMDKLKIVKDQPASEEMFKAENATSEQIRDESSSKYETDETLKHYKKDPSPDVKRRSGTICLSLYGSSSNRQGGERRSKRYKDCCEEPPKTIQITVSSLQKNEGTSKKRKWVELMENDALDTRKRDMRSSLKNCDQSKTPRVHETKPTRVSEVTKENVLSSALTRKRFNQCHRSRSGAHLADKNERKKKRKSLGTQQISMNSYIIRRKTLPSKTLPSSEPVMKSKYELGNPALMPLQDGFGLDFKVLPSSFNFEDEAELNCFQADTLLSVKNDISEYEKAKRRKASHAPTQGTWSFSPLKTKHHSTDVSGSCSLFYEFKKRYQDRKRKMASRQNLNSD